MLSSTADHLYWMARSMERAENTARMLDVTFRMALLKHSDAEPFQEWAAMLTITTRHRSTLSDSAPTMALRTRLARRCARRSSRIP